MRTLSRLGPAVWVLIPLIIGACGGSNAARERHAREVEAIWQAIAEPEELNYAPSLNVAIDEMRRLPEGLLIQDLVVGEGDSVVQGRTVVVRYAGWLPDGTEFDSNLDSEPITVRLGRGDVIEGWEIGLVGMRAGGKRRLIIPPRLAYGQEGMGPVPPFATLVFVVEVVEVR
jgi:FKBP-type peptidyl-prolyl cis-trans isomerase